MGVGSDSVTPSAGLTGEELLGEGKLTRNALFDGVASGELTSDVRGIAGNVAGMETQLPVGSMVLKLDGLAHEERHLPTGEVEARGRWALHTQLLRLVPLRYELFRDDEHPVLGLLVRDGQ